MIDIPTAKELLYDRLGTKHPNSVVFPKECLKLFYKFGFTIFRAFFNEHPNILNWIKEYSQNDFVIREDIWKSKNIYGRIITGWVVDGNIPENATIIKADNVKLIECRTIAKLEDIHIHKDFVRYTIMEIR